MPFQFAAGRWSPRDAPSDDRSRPASIRIVTWNTWFGEHKFDQRRDALLAELARRRPDVIALQEVTPPLLASLLDQSWIRAAYQVSAIELGQRYDVAVLSQLPIRSFAALELPTTMGRKLLVAELACGLVVATVHLESMKQSGAARAAQLAVIQPYLAKFGDTAFVGDMNFKPDDEVETAALDHDFVDAWPALHPTEPGYTADSERNAMRYELKPTPSRKRIDRAFVHGTTWRPVAIELVGTAPIDRDGTFVSDHFGLELALTDER